MNFATLDFALFLPIVFLLYWFAANKNYKTQNFLIVLASYCFYGFWNWKFLALIFLSTVIDYFLGLKLSGEESLNKRKRLLWFSIIVNLGFLGFFKYYNFFIDNFIAAFSLFGVEISTRSLDIILPVGISFYTFQTLSYTIDVYKRKLEPVKNFFAFAAFVSFFPQLVAGPIERATHLLPQFVKKRSFDYTAAVNGLRQILWGLFKKVVIADNCATHVNYIFENSDKCSGSALAVGAFLFAFQIYCDFSGYSDIAIGVSRLFGINLKSNFAFPYFSRDVAEFWRRWHISLSTWFRDYLYIPLGGSQVSNVLKIRNIFIIFIVSGLWHGANWTFVFWGALNAIYFLPLLLLKKNRQNLEIVAKGNLLPSLKEFCCIVMTFSLITFAWIFFRAESLPSAINYLSGLFSDSLFTFPRFPGMRKPIFFFVCIFIVIEWLGRENEYAIERLWLNHSRPLRFACYYILISAIYIFGVNEQPFIYFQF
jgi:alginate O-acetyltransferase complex protein AlgI